MLWLVIQIQFEVVLVDAPKKLKHCYAIACWECNDHFLCFLLNHQTWSESIWYWCATRRFVCFDSRQLHGEEFLETKNKSLLTDTSIPIQHSIFSHCFQSSSQTVFSFLEMQFEICGFQRLVRCRGTELRSYEKKQSKIINRRLILCEEKWQNVIFVASFDFSPRTKRHSNPKNRHKIHSNEWGGVALATIMYFVFFIAHFGCFMFASVTYGKT